MSGNNTTDRLKDLLRDVVALLDDLPVPKTRREEVDAMKARIDQALTRGRGRVADFGNTERIRRLKAEGKKPPEIAAELGITRQAVYASPGWKE